MEEPERGSRRPAKKAGREATERQAQRATAPAQEQPPRPRPRPVPSTGAKQATGVPMAGMSYAQRRAQQAREARGGPAAAPPEPPAKPASPPPAATLDLDLDEDFDLDDMLEDEPGVDVEPEAPSTRRETPSSIYSTRRALATQVNQEVVERPAGSEAKGLEALKQRREAWRRTVKAKEEEGRAPYIARWAKVSFFPFIYLVVSLSSLRKIRYEYAEYYSYDNLYLVLGFLVGAVLLVLVAVSTMLRAKRVKKPILLKSRAPWVAAVVFIGISFYLAFFNGLAYAWLFSIGFLGAGLLVVLAGFGIEKASKGTFWVRDATEQSNKRWLEFVPSLEA